MLLQEFKSDLDLLDYFRDKKNCVEFIENLRWNGKPKCPKCSKEKHQKLKDGRYRCSDKQCYRKYTVTIGTFMENTKISLRKWIFGIYLYYSSLGCISSYNLAKRIGVTQATAWFMCKRIASMSKRNNMELFKKVAKIDETYVGATLGRMSKPRRAKYPEKFTGYTHRMAIIGIVGPDEKNNNRLVLEHTVKNAGKSHIQPIVRKYVDPCAVIVTDQSGVYKDLEKEFKDRIILNHEDKQYRKGEHHGNDIEGSFRHLKDRLGATHKGRVGEKHIQLYLDSFGFRYSTSRLTDYQRMKVVLKNIEGRLKYNDLIQRRPPNVDEDGVILE